MEKLNLLVQKISIGTFFLMPHMIVIWTYVLRKNQQCLGGITKIQFLNTLVNQVNYFFVFQFESDASV